MPEARNGFIPPIVHSEMIEVLLKGWVTSTVLRTNVRAKPGHSSPKPDGACPDTDTAVLEPLNGLTPAVVPSEMNGVLWRGWVTS